LDRPYRLLLAPTSQARDKSGPQLVATEPLADHVIVATLCRVVAKDEAKAKSKLARKTTT
ncbi:hypothetical protein, partial [Paenibacillus algorifonticola]|uniref:hypothetical protein n=1 Tax=Paenibacillus algorifonticola TaxID=684063 RepID=UPI0015A6DD06